MSLRRVAILISLGFAALTITVAFCLVVFTGRLREATDTIVSSLETVHLAERLQINLFQLNREAFLYHLTKNEQHRRNREDQKAEIQFLLSQEERLIRDSENQSVLRELQTLSQDFFLLAERNSDAANAAQEYLKRGQQLQATVDVAAKLTKTNLSRALLLQRQSAFQNQTATVLGVVAAILSFVIIVAMTFGLRFWIIKPMRDLRSVIANFKNLAPPEVTRIKGPAEINEIAKKFEELAGRLMSQREAQLRFLASVAHDLRNPIGAIKMSSQFLSDEGLNSEQQSVAEIVARQADHLDRMVGDLLDASRIESGHLEIQTQVQEIGVLVKDAVTLHRTISTLHQFQLSIPKEPIYCQCDPGRINQVLNNLLSNAIKYSPHGGVISVKLNSTAMNHKIEVKDQGIGLAPEDFESIFEPFRRTKMTRMSIPGVGLGLSVTKKIVEAHGGKIQVESDASGGATFSILLPRHEGPLTLDRPARLVFSSQNETLL